MTNTDADVGVVIGFAPATGSTSAVSPVEADIFNWDQQEFVPLSASISDLESGKAISGKHISSNGDVRLRIRVGELPVTVRQVAVVVKSRP